MNKTKGANEGQVLQGLLGQCKDMNLFLYLMEKSMKDLVQELSCGDDGDGYSRGCVYMLL